MTLPQPEDHEGDEPGRGPDEPGRGAGEETGRDWDAEWRDLTAPLTAEPRPYLLSDTPKVGAGSGPRDYSPAEDPDEDRWFPEEPPPATGSTRTRLAWTGIIGGPLLLLLAIVTIGYAEIWFVGLSLVLFVGGCVLGFSQLPGRRRESGDDGAQV